MSTQSESLLGPALVLINFQQVRNTSKGGKVRERSMEIQREPAGGSSSRRSRKSHQWQLFLMGRYSEGLGLGLGLERDDEVQ